jgi:hypothetical protein
MREALSENRKVEKHTAGKSIYNFNVLTGARIFLGIEVVGFFSDIGFLSGVEFSISCFEVEVEDWISSGSDILKLKDHSFLELDFLLQD